MDKLTGGCLCGAVCYEIEQVFEAGYCHCSMCRKLSGAPVIAWAAVKAENFQITKGIPAKYASSKDGSRYFCSTCGSQLFFRTRVTDDVSVTLGTLDNPEFVQPQIHVFADNHLSWFKLHDSLPRYQDNVIPYSSKRP